MGRKVRRVPGHGVWPEQATLLRVQISEPEYRSEATHSQAISQ